MKEDTYKQARNKAFKLFCEKNGWELSMYEDPNRFEVWWDDAEGLADKESFPFKKKSDH